MKDKQDIGSGKQGHNGDDNTGQKIEEGEMIEKINKEMGILLTKKKVIEQLGKLFLDYLFKTIKDNHRDRNRANNSSDKVRIENDRNGEQSEQIQERNFKDQRRTEKYDNDKANMQEDETKFNKQDPINGNLGTDDYDGNKGNDTDNVSRELKSTKGMKEIPDNQELQMDLNDTVILDNIDQNFQSLLEESKELEDSDNGESTNTEIPEHEESNIRKSFDNASSQIADQDNEIVEDKSRQRNSEYDDSENHSQNVKSNEGHLAKERSIDDISFKVQKQKKMYPKEQEESIDENINSDEKSEESTISKLKAKLKNLFNLLKADDLKIE